MHPIGMWLCLLALSPSSQEPSSPVAKLVEKLNSDVIDEREEAQRSLKSLGKEVLPLLRKARESGKGEPELLARLGLIIHFIETRELLTTELRKAIPGIEEKLAFREDRVWTEMFLEAVSFEGQKRKYPSLRARDLGSLASRALRGTVSSDEKHLLFREILPGRLPCDQAVILEHLKHPFPSIRIKAIQALRHLVGREAIPSLARLLDDPDHMVCMDVCFALAELEDYSAIPRMIQFLEGVDTHRQRHVLHTLPELEALEAIPDILDLLKDNPSEPTLPMDAASALARMGAYQAVPPIIQLLKKDLFLSVRSVMAQDAFAQPMILLRAKEVVPERMHLLKDKDEMVRSDALEMLYVLGDSRSAAEVLPLLKDPYDRARSAAASALGQLGYKEAVPELLPLLADAEYSVRAAAAKALGRLGEVKAVAPLISLLEDPYVEVREQVVRALGALGEGRTLLPQLASKDARIRSRVAGVFASQGRKEWIPEISRLLGDPDLSVRLSAARALGELRAKECLPELILRLRSEHPEEREEIARALGAMGVPDAIRPLSGLLTDDDVSVRKQALESLSELKASDPADAVSRLLSDADYEVRVTAARVLCQWGSREGVPLLLRCSTRLEYLHALRQPGLWSSLRGKKTKGDHEGTPSELLTKLAREAGMELFLSPAVKDSGLLSSCIRSVADGISLWDGLKAATGRRYELVLEPGRISVLTRDEALLFWNIWAEKPEK